MKIFFLLKEGIINLGRARMATLISIISISLSLTLIGIFAVVGQNVKLLFNRFYKQVEIEAFLDPTLDKNEIEHLRQEILKNSQVSELKFISPEEALAEFLKSFGEDISSVLNENPLPPSFRIVLRPAFSSPELIEKFKKDLESLNGIQEVLYHEEIIRLIHRYYKIGIGIGGFLGIILVIVVTILIFNTIRLTIHSRRDIIQIMRLVGATDLFIKSPFVIEGMIQGVLGGVVAVITIKFLSSLVQDIVYSQFVVTQNIYLFILGMGLFFGWIGGYLSVNKYLST